MIVLHSGLLAGHLYLWGECSPGPWSDSGKRPGRKPKTSDPRALPHGAGYEGLKPALEEAGISISAPKKAAQKVLMWLPTMKGIPVASSPLIAEWPESNEKAVLSPWMVTAIALSAPETIELLCVGSDKAILAPGILMGKDLSFCVQAMRFAGSLAARQQFLPGVAEREGAYFAEWKPVIAGLDGGRLHTLAKAMPSACRALGRELSLPPDASSLAALSDFVGRMVDHLARFSAAGTRALVPAKGPRGEKPPAFESLHDQWLFALRSPEGRLEGSQAELAQFALQIQDWHRPVAVSTTAAFRLCFRLEEPKPDEAGGRRKRNARDSWKVRYLLQASDDPSLLVPAKEAWNASGREASVLNRGAFSAREFLLSSLGQASNICPHIETSLKASIPDGYDLNTQGACDFLTQKALVLEQSGFGVMLPAWWIHNSTKARLTGRGKVQSPKMSGGSTLSLDRILYFDWQVALGDEIISFEELQTLAALKAPLVRVRGQWVQLNADEIQAALDFWRRKEAGKTTVRQVIRMALGAEKPYAGVPFEGIEATGWVGDILAQLEGRTEFEELEAPNGFRGMLRPYQVRGYSWLSFLRRWGLGACLADDMGLGKTVQTLALLQKDRESNGTRSVLLVCPMSVVNNWEKEAARFTPDLSVLIHHGIGRNKGKSFKTRAQSHDLVITSYALLHRDLEAFHDVAWAGIILDEAQNIKNPETRQAKAARALKAEYHIALTGTPVENNVGDLWSIMEFLNPGFLYTQAEFKRKFFIPIQANRDLEAAERLKRLTGTFILRRVKTDKNIIADLPEKNEMKVFCTLTKEQASLYEAVVKNAARSLDATEGIQRKGVVLATLSKLKQVCNHPAQFLGDGSSIPGRSGKLLRLAEMMEEIISVGDRALVFSQFAEMGEILTRYLQDAFGQEVLFLHGSVAKKHRDRMVERFQTEKNGPRIFILSLKAGGTGLNLTQANHVFHFDRWWNPAVENQATDRAFRIGQSRNVQVHKFICAGTLEERIDEMIQRKLEISEGVVGAGEHWLTELSTAELKKLFALDKDCTQEG